MGLMAAVATFVMGAAVYASDTVQVGNDYMNVQGSGQHVDTVKQGVDNLNRGTQICGKHVITKNGGVIHTSTSRCYTGDGPATPTFWGPTYNQNMNYPVGTKFCGWFTDPHTINDRPCVTITQ